MRQFINNKAANTAAAILLISAILLIWSWIEHGHGQPACNGTCTVRLPAQNQEWRLEQICNAQEQSDDLLIHCVFDIESQDKVSCYADLKQMDQMVLDLKRKYKLAFGEYPVCDKSFRKGN